MFMNTKNGAYHFPFFIVIHSVLKRVSCLYYTTMSKLPETLEVLSYGVKSILGWSSLNFAALKETRTLGIFLVSLIVPVSHVRTPIASISPRISDLILESSASVSFLVWISCLM